jgi:cephalosporin hydroxylase
LNVHGSSKSIEIDLVKLREAITVLDKKVEEKEVVAEKAAVVENIDIENITEEEFLKQAVEKIMPVQKTQNKMLTKESFIKIFKYTGDYAKIKSREIKQKAQEQRAAEFGKDPKKYLEALKTTVQAEELVYEKSSAEMFDKLCITPELFERSQQELMMDPYVSMELFNMGISMEQPSG